MLGKTFSFLSSKIWKMLSNGQSSRQPSGEPPSNGQPSSTQSDQNPWNKLFHTSSWTYPCRPLSGPLSTMHKWGAAKMSGGENTSSTQTQSIKSLKTMIVNESPHNDSRKLAWHVLWSTQWHISTMWVSKELV
jgi:hypothetical protein